MNKPPNQDALNILITKLVTKSFLIVDKILDRVLEDLDVSIIEEDKKLESILIEAEDVDIH